MKYHGGVIVNAAFHVPWHQANNSTNIAKRLWGLNPK
jgi:hypothetical protein